MNYMDTKTSFLRLDPNVVSSCAEAIKKEGWIFLPGKQWQESFSLTNEERISFSLYWEGLELDLHMGDNGSYRYRRYGSFEVEPAQGRITMLPHGPYVQSKAVNPLNGDVERHFSPLENNFVAHPFFSALLLGLGEMYNQVCGTAATWIARLHPYRIKAELHVPGKPTPEGRHRDGVDFIAMMLVDRYRVEGGETTITDNEGRGLYSKKMINPLDIVIGDDARIMHEVSEIYCAGQSGHRDALVIAFSKATVHD